MNILIIDDDAAIRYMLKEICHFAGWKSIDVSNGKEGVESFRKNGADVILVDYHMPEMDGFQTVKHIRAFDKYVPILVLTVDERQEIANRFLDAGATDFALKPVKAPDLISRIQLHKRLYDATSSTREAYTTKGINQGTLSLIEEHFQTLKEPITVDELSKQLGLAYPTVYRYVQHFLKQGKVEAIMSYQHIGRPKNYYLWKFQGISER
jgi:two-component system, CitB family, response regulator DctR